MYLFFRFLLSIYFHAKYKIRVFGEENIPKKLKKGDSGYVIAANHQNYYDPPLLASLIKAKFSFMAKQELFEGKKSFKWLITVLGAFPVKRGGDNSESLERAVSDVKSGRVLIIFPEGKRSLDGKISRGRSGTALIASKAETDILPACIMYRRNEKGKICGVDVIFGKMVLKSELPTSANTAETSSRKEFAYVLKKITNRLISDITALQNILLEKNNVSLEEYSEKKSL